MRRITCLMLIALGFLTLFSCKKEGEDPAGPSGRIVFSFKHVVDGQPLVFDTLKYVNAAGNPYLVSEIMYFVSEVTLYKSDGTKKLIDDWQDIYYVDTDIPGSLEWLVYDSIPEGMYDSVSFIFGITEEKNKNGLFMNFPEINMFWPDYLGGGYHYLMINGHWKSPDSHMNLYNYHMGIGRDTSDQGEVFYVQNYFRVGSANSGFVMAADDTVEMEISMHVESWFDTPHVWNWDSIGGAIMENQSAMNWARENGHDVFSISRK